MPENVSKLARTKTNRPEESVDRSTLEEKLGFCVRMADRAIYKTFVQEAGITPVQYSIFRLVADNEGMAQGAIGEALNLDRASTMTLMDKLQEAGLIVRRKSPVDRRRHAIYLTEKGRRDIVTMEDKVRKVDNKFKQKLSDKQLQELFQYLDWIREIRQ